jgi:adenine/guanine phosphoribosyltransferase-like PRPP-binding protein
VNALGEVRPAEWQIPKYVPDLRARARPERALHSIGEYVESETPAEIVAAERGGCPIAITVARKHRPRS